MAKAVKVDPSIRAARHEYARSALSLKQIGLRMGYPGSSARKSAWQFLNNTADPRLSMLRRFARAVGCSIECLIEPEQG